MKLLLTIVIVSSLGNHVKAQVSWDKTVNWRIYKIPFSVGQKINSDSLTFYPSILVDSIKLDSLLDKADFRPSYLTGVWMGGFTAAFADEKGFAHKILINTYDGIFYDAREKKYYKVGSDKVNAWLDFWAKEKSKFTTQ